MRMRSSFLRSVGVWLALLLVAGAAQAAAPEPWQMGLQPAASPIMERVVGFHNLLLWIITIVCLFVAGLLVYVSVKFAESKNPTPSRRTHNTLLEVVWTAVPVLILVIIAVPSFKLLYYEDVLPKTDLTIKAIGKQWYWTYEYPDHGNFTFDALLVEDSDLKPSQKRLLETDNVLVIPAGVNVKVQVTANDVLHSWAMPSMGVKVDGVPGRLNEIWLHADAPGTYYGQCSELCGVRHGFMPITLRAVPDAEFQAWIKEAQQKFARVDDPVRVAAMGAVPSSAR